MKDSEYKSEYLKLKMKYYTEINEKEKEVDELTNKILYLENNLLHISKNNNICILLNLNLIKICKLFCIFFII
jgi:hypothetical protein